MSLPVPAATMARTVSVPAHRLTPRLTVPSPPVTARTSRPAAIPTRARDRALVGIAAGLDVLAVTGGDGTVNLGVNLCAGTETVLAIVAAGTGNDIARALQLPLHDAQAAAEVISGGTVRTIDAGRHADADGA